MNTCVRCPLQMSRRHDCLVQRMQAAALSGHGGAQLAVCRDGARGAKIEVWWDGDKCYYPGIIAGWDPATTEYVVSLYHGVYVL